MGFRSRSTLFHFEFITTLAVISNIANTADTYSELKQTENYRELLKITNTFLGISSTIYAEKTDDEIIAKATEMAKNRLKDPFSAQFRHLSVVRKPDQVYVCGEVNSKNSYGAYGGFTSFIASPFPGVMHLGSDTAGSLIISDFC